MLEKLKNMTYAELPHAYDAWHHMIADFHDIPEIFTGERNGKRNTEVQASLYDAMMAEIMDEKDARLRKYLRKHEIRNGNPVRKEKRKAYIKEKCYTCDPWNGWDIVRNVRIKEKIRTDAEDWELEAEAIREYAEWEKINAELKAEVEQKRMEESRKLCELNEWLKYA